MKKIIATALLGFLITGCGMIHHTRDIHVDEAAAALAGGAAEAHFNTQITTPGQFELYFTAMQVALQDRRLSAADRERGYAIMIDSLQKKHPYFAGYWNSASEYNGKIVFQNNALYDMNRIHVGQMKLAEVGGKYYTLASQKAQLAQLDPSGITRELMRNGKPGVGPDNKPIELVSMFDTPNAPLFEMSATERELLGAHHYSVHKLDGSLNTGDRFKDYWKSRRDDFIDKRGLVRKGMSK